MKAGRPGYFFLVVGPSGAGKDSLMDGAKALLPADQFRFAKRTVTRPPGMVGEDYESCNPKTFAVKKVRGEFLATWQAHGYEYGLPQNLKEDQLLGKHIIANGSRSMVNAMRDAVDNLVIIHVTAPVELLAKRLAMRGRETPAEIEHRLSRQALQFPEDLAIYTVNNDASLEEGIQRFTDTILSVTSL